MVGAELGLGAEGHETVETDEHMLADVRAHMDLEAIDGAETLGAGGTDEGVLAGVNAHVGLELVVGAEALGADGTREGSVVDVDASVDLELVHGTEALVTVRTGVRLRGTLAGHQPDPTTPAGVNLHLCGGKSQAQVLV